MGHNVNQNTEPTAEQNQITQIIHHLDECIKKKTSPEEYQTNLRQCLGLANETLELARKTHLETDEALVQLRIGDIYRALNQPLEAFAAIRIAEAIFLRIQDLHGYSNTLMTRGLIHYELNQHDDALECQMKALEIKKELAQRHAIGCALNNIGIIYAHLGSYEKALEMYRQAYDYYDNEKYPESRINLIGNMGVSLAQLKRFDEAIDCMKECLEARESASDFRGIGRVLNNMGQMLFESGKPMPAMDHLHRAQDIFILLKDDFNLANVKVNLARVQINCKEFPQAFENLQFVATVADKFHGTDVEIEYWQLLSDYYRGIGDYQQTFEAYTHYVELREALLGKETERKIEAIRLKYEMQQYEKDYDLAIRKNEELNRCNDLIVQQNDELERINEELQSMLNTKNRIFSIIAHDLRNPLNAMLLSVEYLHDQFEKQAPENVYRLLGGMVDSMRRIDSLIDNLLLWASSESNDIQFLPEKLDLQKMVEDTIALSRPFIEKKHIELNLVLEPQNVIGDRNMVATILRNLLSNAVKYTEPEKRIEIRVGTENGMALLVVRDEGIGMDDALVQNILQGKALKSSRGTKGERGTGLGLSICREFIERNQGQFEIESHVGEGSCFTVYLPKA